MGLYQVVYNLCRGRPVYQHAANGHFLLMDKVGSWVVTPSLAYSECFQDTLVWFGTIDFKGTLLPTQG